MGKMRLPCHLIENRQLYQKKNNKGTILCFMFFDTSLKEVESILVNQFCDMRGKKKKKTHMN